MKNPKFLGLLVSVTVLGGCQGVPTSTLVNTGLAAVQIATLSDADVKKNADGACVAEDASNKIAPANSKYSKRLANVAKSLGNQVEGTPVNYKVYITKDVNAFAMPNGCIRVYTGLMDLMTDNEVEGVLGHEMGHVALGHSKKALQVAYAAAAARSAAASTSGAAQVLADSQFGDFAEELINAQFSQSEETEADEFSVTYLNSHKINPEGLATSMDKLAKLGGGGGAEKHSMFSSHPPSDERAKHIRDLISAKK
jgi:putative metalloprotease